MTTDDSTGPEASRPDDVRPGSAERPYHHGNLRAALLEAAEAELEAMGIERFSLRAVAKRAGVSHAAPAHHFGDATGLLTALAAIGLIEGSACSSSSTPGGASDPSSKAPISIAPTLSPLTTSSSA